MSGRITLDELLDGLTASLDGDYDDELDRKWSCGQDSSNTFYVELSRDGAPTQRFNFTCEEVTLVEP